GEILQTGGRYADAQAAFETAEHLYRVAGDRERYANLSARIAWVEADQGNHQAAVTRLEHALQEETTLAPAERSALYLTLAQLYATRGEFGSEAALAASERATQLALIANDEQGLVRANARRGALLVETAGRRVEGVAVLREVATHAEAIGDRWSLQRAFTGLGEWHRHAGLFTLAHHFHTLAVETAEARGDPLDMSFALFLRGDVEYYRGDWRAARTDWEYAVALTRDLLPSWRTPYPVAALASLDLYEGKPELAMRQFARSVELAANGNDVQFMRYVAWFESERDLLERRPEAARSRLEQLLDRPGERSEQVTDLLHLLAWAHLELGDLSRAEATLAAGLARAHADESRVVIASLQRVQGMLLARRGRLEDAGETLERTIARCREMPFPHEALRSHHVYGQLLASKGETQGARAQYEAALTICDQLGERLYAEHVERAIAALPASSESLP
ncbi:MAG TPA: tetratricopeptide repeat protein, partial [Ktedonobacterales bacterium]